MKAHVFPAIFLTLVLSAAVSRTSCQAQAGPTISGQVVDAGNRPVAQIPVLAQAANGTIVSSSVTDGSGTFRFYNLPSGAYKFYPLNRPQALVSSYVTAGQSLRVGVIVAR